MNTVKQLNIPVTIAPMFCDSKATMDITYNHKIGDRSNQINITYHEVGKNVNVQICLYFGLSRLKIWLICGLKVYRS
jgi:hypothetical protein